MTYPPDDANGFIDAVAASGVDGFLTPRSARSYAHLARELREADVQIIHFLEHDPKLRDIQAAIEGGRGYVMLQANPGPTGIKSVVLPDSANVIEMLRRLGLTTPIALGIGIATAEQAQSAIRMGASGVVIGSLTVERMLDGRRALREFLLELREALDAV
jgi:tryptophan synthase alpha subunit